nr:aspartate aminotransferase family protein [Chloroflexia bacterium]
HTPVGLDPEYLKASGGDDLAQTFEIGMLVKGVHLFHSGGFFSTAHTTEDVDKTLAATRAVAGQMKDEGMFRY